jgi:hypothetical protein
MKKCICCVRSGGNAVADKESYLELMNIAAEAIDEYTAGDKRYLLSLQETSLTHHDEAEGILALIDRGIGVLPLAEFDILLGIHVVIHKYLYRMWCKHEPLPPGPLATVPRSDDPVWRGRQTAGHVGFPGGAFAQAKNEQDVAKLLELINQINQINGRLATKQERSAHRSGPTLPTFQDGITLVQSAILPAISLPVTPRTTPQPSR